MFTDVVELLILGAMVSCCRVVDAEMKPFQCSTGYPPGECHLTHMGLTSFPMVLPPDTTKLHADDNLLEDLQKGALQGLKFLEEITLEKNQFREVTTFMFDGATRLEHINLAGCLIKWISDEAFCHTPKLSYLDLQDNRLEQFRPAIFNCLQNLSKLLLKSNGLTTLEAPTGYYHSFLMMSLSVNPFKCTLKMAWLQNRKSIGYIRDPGGKEQTPECRNYADVPWYDVNLNGTKKEERDVVVKTTQNKPMNNCSVGDKREEEPPKPVQFTSQGNPTAVILAVVFGIALFFVAVGILIWIGRRNGVFVTWSSRLREIAFGSDDSHSNIKSEVNTQVHYKPVTTDSNAFTHCHVQE